MRNVLVVSTVEHAEDELRAQVGDADTVLVVVPVVRQGVLELACQRPTRVRTCRAGGSGHRRPASR